jgi:hypothetical protein
LFGMSCFRARGFGEVLRTFCLFWFSSHGHGCEGGPCVKMPCCIKSENSNYIECNQSMYLDVLRGLFVRQRGKPPIPSTEERRLACASPASKGDAWIPFSPITGVSLLASSTVRHNETVRMSGRSALIDNVHRESYRIDPIDSSTLSGH